MRGDQRDDRSRDQRGDLEALDDALVRLRRLWATPRTREELGAAVGADVDLSQVLVAEAVARQAGAGEEATVGAVAARLAVEPSTASRLVDRAVGGGFVLRAASGADARRSALRLTAAGEDLARRALDYRLDQLRGLLSGWAAEEVAALAHGLRRFADEVGRPHPAARS